MNTSVITYVFLAFIVVVFLGSFAYTFYAEKKNKLLKNRRIIDSLPNIISSLGVIGTFVGITIGLSDFDTNPSGIDNSISTLLEGLKTAFYTSLAGMVGSLLLRFLLTDKLFDKKDEGISSTEQAATNICIEIQKMSSLIATTLVNTTSDLSSIKKNQLTFFDGVQSQLDVLNESVGNKMINTLGTLVSLNRNLDNSMVQNNQIIGNMLAAISLNTSISQKQLEETVRYSEVIKSVASGIESKMLETNNLLTNKFDEFSELLKKSNTEALVEVMTRVTEEFQKQMNALISRLVKENFEQLNKSVEQLNVWQKENKEMISKLTTQYKQMTTEFESTSNCLTSVAKNTNTLVGDGGKLSQLINQLNKVMIDDKKFVEIATKLEQTVSLSRDSIVKFDESSKSLDNWIKKHKNFVEEIEKLIEKLEELNKIRDYGEEFWADTKESMDEGIAIIKKGSESLNSQLTDLDRQFYARLSTTLSELDTCIQAIVDKL